MGEAGNLSCKGRSYDSNMCSLDGEGQGLLQMFLGEALRRGEDQEKLDELREGFGLLSVSHVPSPPSCRTNQLSRFFEREDSFVRRRRTRFEDKKDVRSGNKEELKIVQTGLRKKIRDGKCSYKRKMEDQLQNNDVRGVWRSLNTISGYKVTTPQPEVDHQCLNDLNIFFNRFDQASAPPIVQTVLTSTLPSLTLGSEPFYISSTPTPPYPIPQIKATHSPEHPTTKLSLTVNQVRGELRRLKMRKAAGPDGISPRLLRSCADQLCETLQYMFNLSLRLGQVPQLWKTSCLVPVPKTPHPKDMNSYRPVALTSHLMKTFERLVLGYLHPLVNPSMDPLQFAYRPGIGVDDNLIYLLHRSLSHLKKAGSSLRNMFYDFSSAFNTIQPALLRDRLGDAGVDLHLSAWILDYLTSRPQSVIHRPQWSAARGYLNEQYWHHSFSPSTLQTSPSTP
ncbi:hypothetical protein PO909_003895 [Leuciscus waleckii]